MATEVIKAPGEPFTITWDYDAVNQVLIVHFRIDSASLSHDDWSVVATQPVSVRSLSSNAPSVSKRYRVVAVGSSGLEGTSSFVVVNINAVPPPPPTNVQVF